jgi:hypothetical protein
MIPKIGMIYRVRSGSDWRGSRPMEGAGVDELPPEQEAWTGRWTIDYGRGTGNGERGKGECEEGSLPASCRALLVHSCRLVLQTPFGTE